MLFDYTRYVPKYLHIFVQYMHPVMLLFVPKFLWYSCYLFKWSILYIRLKFAPVYSLCMISLTILWIILHLPQHWQWCHYNVHVKNLQLNFLFYLPLSTGILVLSRFYPEKIVHRLDLHFIGIWTTVIIKFDHFWLDFVRNMTLVQLEKLLWLNMPVTFTHARTINLTSYCQALV